MELNTRDINVIYKNLQDYDYGREVETTDVWTIARYLRDIYSRLEKLEKDNELSSE